MWRCVLLTHRRLHNSGFRILEYARKCTLTYFHLEKSISLPSAKKSSFDGYTIWPFKGRNTKGICSAVSVEILLLTKEISEHSPTSLTHIPLSSRYVFRWFRHWHLQNLLSLWFFDLRYFIAVLVEISIHKLSLHSLAAGENWNESFSLVVLQWNGFAFGDFTQNRLLLGSRSWIITD